MRKVILAGYFGEGNLGDDAIMGGCLEALHAAQIEPVVMYGGQAGSVQGYAVRCIPRRTMSAYAQEIQNADALVLGGGSIFQDVTSWRSTLYYANLVKVAKKAGKKVVMLGQGVGPLTHCLGKKAATAAFNAADAIVVRDPGSVQTLKSLGVKQIPRVGADMAYLLPNAEPGGAVESFSVGGMPAIGISPRPFGTDDSTIALFSDLCSLFIKGKMVPVLIAMDRGEDAKLIAAIREKSGGRIPTLKDITTPGDFQRQIMRLDGLVAMRLHAGILAACAGTAPFMLSYDPKVSAFSQLMGLPAAMSMKGISAQRVFDAYASFYEAREKMQRAVTNAVAKQRVEAQKNIDVLLGCLG